MSQNVNSEQLDKLRKSFIKQSCEQDHLFFTRYFFKKREGIKFKVNWHHILVCEAVEKVIKGEIQNLIINIPPGSSKTELVVINLIARGMAINPNARFLHLSYSDELASLNSSKAKDIVESEEFQELWPLKLRTDSKAKKRWSVQGDTVYNNNKLAGHPPITGSVYATALGGSITGFRAGHMTECFQGAIIVDDPLKVDDAFSKANRDRANRRLVSTVKSRKANPRTPTIVIMQRLAEEDPTGFIKAGNVPGIWHHVVVPAHIDDAWVEANVPEHLRDKVDRSERDEAGRFSYWPYKEPVADLCELETKDKYVYNGQMQQRPSALGGSLIQGAWFVRVKMFPQISYRIITVDTAQKTAERNDYSVFECWGLTVDGRYALLDVLRGKWEAQDLRKRAREFWSKHSAKDAIFELGKLRSMYVEDKSSGTGLIQELQNPETPGSVRIPIVPVERIKDKLTEWMDAIPSIEAGLCLVPEDAPWLSDYIGEMESITGNMTHAHDDQLDPTCDAIDILGAQKGSMNTWAKLGGAAHG